MKNFSLCDRICSIKSLAVVMGIGVVLLLVFSTLPLAQVGAGPAARPAAQSGGTTERVSVASDGTQGNGDSGGYYNGPSISADGRYVAFSSYASNLVPSDTNGYWAVFVHDRAMGQTSRVSIASDGTQMGGHCPSISADGRHVAFESSTDIFVHDRETGETTRVSIASDGTPGNSYSYCPSISADGRYVAFTSSASNLVPGDTNGCIDVFVHDWATGQTTRVSVASDGTQGNGDAEWIYPLSISADGRYVAFDSWATNLVPGDNSSSDVFVHDRATRQTTLVSVTSDGAQGGNSFCPSISADGRYVAFVSGLGLIPGEPDCTIAVHDRVTGQTTCVSVASDGTPDNGVFWNPPSISADGRYVAFDSDATNLVPGDTNGRYDVFIHDRATGQTTRVSVASSEHKGTGTVGVPLFPLKAAMWLSHLKPAT
jgi:Tol biopolymer transport system component